MRKFVFVSKKSLRILNDRLEDVLYKQFKITDFEVHVIDDAPQNIVNASEIIDDMLLNKVDVIIDSNLGSLVDIHYGTKINIMNFKIYSEELKHTLGKISYESITNAGELVRSDKPFTIDGVEIVPVEQGIEINGEFIDLYDILDYNGDLCVLLYNHIKY